MDRLDRQYGQRHVIYVDSQEENASAREVLRCLILESEKDRTVDETLDDESTAWSQFSCPNGLSDSAYMKIINCVAIVPRRICRRRSMTARACIGIDIMYALPFRDVVACSALALCLYAITRSGLPTNSCRYESMSARFSRPALDARNADANSSGVCGTRPLRSSSRTMRAVGSVTGK